MILAKPGSKACAALAIPPLALAPNAPNRPNMGPPASVVSRTAVDFVDAVGVAPDLDAPGAGLAQVGRLAASLLVAVRLDPAAGLEAPFAIQAIGPVGVHM